MPIQQIRTSMLELAYEEHGTPNGPPVVLLHGFPYDPRAYDEMAPALAAKGARVIVPYLRGYGPTRFVSEKTLRSGQQAALAHDLLDLLDALQLSRSILVGYDWGGRAACIVAALWPKRVRGLVTGGGYNIQDIAHAGEPAAPEVEHQLWYQYYFHTARGKEGLKKNRKAFCELLWKLWSPSWNFDEATYSRSAASFDNPDFVEVVIHSYRHRYGGVAGDAALEEVERQLARQPAIHVPTIALFGGNDGVARHQVASEKDERFTEAFEARTLAGIGHNIPQEAPEATFAAVMDLLAAT
ncbi:MAG: alpha/beta hydrolase [Burkholderiaceae bacterium]